jgi:GNAT superfamily N-acetyltransferase
MDIKQILALYDEEQRKTIEYPGMRREATNDVIHHVDLLGSDGLVIFSSLDTNNAVNVIREQVTFFEELGQDFEWKHYEHDSPPDLKERLESCGFEIGEAESIVVLDAEHVPSELRQPVTHDIRRITDPKQIEEVMVVQDEIWQTDKDSLARRQLVHEMEHTPESLSVYVVYVSNRPVASAWIRFTKGSRFSSLWAGSTLPDFRRRGIYTEMLSVRVHEALERGKRFLTVDAGPMSRPILEKLGFQLLTISHPCQWRSRKGINLAVDRAL